MAPAESITLSLAGARFDLVRGPDCGALALPPDFLAFVDSQPRSAPIASYITLPPDERLLPAVEPSRIVWQSNHWCLAEGGPGAWLLAIHALPDERRITVAEFARDFSRGRLLPIIGRHGTATSYWLNYPCDQVMVLNRLLSVGVGVVHAGAVAFDGQGLMFCGRSGAGKTTLSRLCRDAGATLLNDDRQFLWPDERGGWVQPTPWHGSEPEINNRTVPLRAIFHLVQAPLNRVTPIAGAAAAARLLGNTVAPFYFADGMERALEIWDRLVERVPSYQMEFTPTQDAVALARDILG